MKSLSLLFILSLSSNLALACDANFAQIQADITSVENQSRGLTCKAYVSMGSIRDFNESRNCALSKYDVVRNGIEFPVIDGECTAPAQIYGTLMQENGTIVMD